MTITEGAMSRTVAATIAAGAEGPDGHPAAPVRIGIRFGGKVEGRHPSLGGGIGR